MKRDPFRRAADRLAEYLLSKADYLQNPKKQRLREELTALSGGRKTAVREYYAGKIRMVLLLLTGLFILTIVLLVFAPSRNDSLPEQRLKRREFGMAPQLQELEAEIEGESERQGLTVRVHAQRLTKDETSRLLEKAREELEQGMLGENLSRDEVRTALNLPAALAEGRVRAEYLTVPYGIIGQDGTIRRRTEERGEIVEITATLSCQGRKLLYETAVQVFPPRLSPEERLWEDLKQRTQEAESEQGESEYFTLPDEVDGRGVLWNYPRDRTGRRLVLLIAFLIPVLYFVMDLQVHQKAQERKEQLELDYPGFLWKLTMLLGAGMPIRAALLKMASAYERQKEKSRKRYAYEELCSTCREMQSGVAEAEAYERFGKRCGLRSYIKLGALLAQNMKKGSRGLAGILQKEASISMDERRSLARRQGERAGTKLLFPMLMMLGVVLLILMVPAFLSLN